jgi:hypothetical protein
MLNSIFLSLTFLKAATRLVQVHVSLARYQTQHNEFYHALNPRTCRSNNISTQHSCVYVYFKPKYMHPCIQTRIVLKYMLVWQYIGPNIIRFSYALNLNI